MKKYIGLIGGALLLTSGLSAATTLYSTNFTSAEDASWTEAGNLIASSAWDGSSSLQTTVVAGSGIATNTSASNRQASLAQGYSMAVGETWTITSSIAADNQLNRFHEVFNIGISADGGSTSVLAGASFFADTENLWVAGFQGQAAANDAGTYVTDVAAVVDTFVTSIVTITKSATANEFNVTATIWGDTGAGLSHTVTDAALYADSEIFLTYDFDETDKALGSLESMSLVTSIPEPSAYALLGGLLALGFVMVRRRK